MNANIDSITYCSDIPKIENLSFVLCGTKYTESPDSSAKSEFHWRVMKCRLLSFLMPEIISTPTMNRCQQIRKISIGIIAPNEFIHNELGMHLKNLNMTQYGMPQKVTIQSYTDALLFSIQSKIAPLWLKIGDFFVQKDYFLSLQKIFPAIFMNIELKDGEVKMKLVPKAVDSPFVKLENFSLPTMVLANFEIGANERIDFSKFECHYVHVLPSLKKGRVVTIYKNFPTNQIFQDYDQLRRHWKNMYGYRLPKSSTDMFFLDVKFIFSKDEYFLYPSICVMRGQPKCQTCYCPNNVAAQFIHDCNLKLSVVCGKNIKFEELSQKIYNTTTPWLTPGNSNSIPNSVASSKFTQNMEFSGKYHFNPFIKKRVLTEIQSDNDDEMESCATSSTSNQHTRPYIAEKHVVGINNKLVTHNDSVAKYFQESKSNLKRKHNQIEENSKNIKLKQKSNIDDDTSYETMNEIDDGYVERKARSNELAKLKCHMLKDWLKRHSIPFKGKALKAELIKKVLQTLQIDF